MNVLQNNDIPGNDRKSVDRHSLCLLPQLGLPLQRVSPKLPSSRPVNLFIKILRVKDLATGVFVWLTQARRNGIECRSRQRAHNSRDFRRWPQNMITDTAELQRRRVFSVRYYIAPF